MPLGFKPVTLYMQTTKGCYYQQIGEGRVRSGVHDAKLQLK